MAVQNERSPLKNPWVMAPAVKLIPVYLQSDAMCVMGKFMRHLLDGD